MQDAVESVLESYRPGDRTIFFVDESRGERSHDLFLSSSRYVVLDCKNLQTKRLSSLHNSYPVLEEARHSLVYAMKYGRTLVLRMGDAVADFITGMCDETCKDREKENPLPPHEEWQTLPRGFMVHNAQLVRDRPESFLRKQDWREIKDGDCVALHPEFKLVITTSIAFEQAPELFVNGRFGLPGSVEDYQFIRLS